MKKKSIRLFKPSFNNDEIVALKKFLRDLGLAMEKKLKNLRKIGVNILV